MIYKRFLFALVAACAVSTCTNSEAPRASATEVTEIALAEIPQSVRDVVSAVRPEFETSEVLKKVRDGRVYYDVEGELPNGEEIEFDVLMTKNGPEIVEIQRDLDWDAVPLIARSAVNETNTDSLEVVRIIESLQTDESIIYEIFVDGHTSEPRFEIRVTDGVAEVLPTPWKH